MTPSSGGNLLSTPEGAAAMLGHQADDGARIGLYLRPRTARLTQGESRDGRLLAQYWAEGDTAFAVVAPATQTQALRIAPLLRDWTLVQFADPLGDGVSVAAWVRSK